LQQFSLVWDSWTQLGLSPETNLVVGELGCARGFLLHEFEKVARQLYCWEPDPDMVWVRISFFLFFSLFYLYRWAIN
jgi:hypothetical protein